MEIEKSLLRALKEVPTEELSDMASSAAFNLDFASGDELLNYMENRKHPPNRKKTLRDLERALVERNGDRAWIKLHEK